MTSGVPFEQAVGYSRAVGAGDFIFVSGCTSIAHGKVVYEGDLARQTEQALLLQFNAPREIVTEPGLHTKIPWAQSVVYIDKRLLNLDRRDRFVRSACDPRFRLFTVAGVLKLLDEIAQSSGQKTAEEAPKVDILERWELEESWVVVYQQESRPTRRQHLRSRCPSSR